MGGTAIYARESHDKAGDAHNVGDQVATAQTFAIARAGGEVPASLVFVDNDISAFTGVHRPGYERLIKAIKRGDVSTVMVFQTSRLWRNRRERADGIEIMKARSVAVLAARGPSLDMSTAYGRGMAGLLGEFDTMESEVKSERQTHANEQAAKRGQRRKGTPRPFGYADDHVSLHPEEAPAVEAACRMLLGGGTVSGIAREWTRLGLRPPQAPYGPLVRNPWNRESVRAILTNPAIAGLSVYKGEIVGSGTGIRSCQRTRGEPLPASLTTQPGSRRKASGRYSAGWQSAPAGMLSRDALPPFMSPVTGASRPPARTGR